MRTGLGSSSLLAVCSAVLLACAVTTSSPGTNPEPDAGDLDAGSAALAGRHSGGANGSSPTLLVGGTAGSAGDNSGGELSLGGAADPDAFHGPVDLCLAADEIPDNWGAAGATDVGRANCPVGVLGRFAFNHCRYELLEAPPFDVDPFTGGHSHCCYRSSLVGCP